MATEEKKMMPLQDIPNVGTIVEISSRMRKFLPDTRFESYRAKVISVAKLDNLCYQIRVEGYNGEIILNIRDNEIYVRRLLRRHRIDITF